MKIGTISDVQKIKQKALQELFPKKMKLSVGLGSCGIAAGADAVYDALKKEVKKKKLDIQIAKTGCLGFCGEEPMVNLYKPGFPLVMHGSSSVPQEEVARINAAGGKLLGAKGVDATQFKRAAQLGVTKVNIDTDGRLVWTRVHREYFLQNPDKFDLRGPGKIFIKEYAKFIAEKNQYLGSAGQLETVRKAV